jgi:hypothetical protein
MAQKGKVQMKNNVENNPELKSFIPVSAQSHFPLYSVR